MNTPSGNERAFEAGKRRGREEGERRATTSLFYTTEQLEEVSLGRAWDLVDTEPHETSILASWWIEGFRAGYRVGVRNFMKEAAQ